MRAACKRLGLEFREGQQNYKWYGYSVGDYPLPAGFTKEDLGKCAHAIAMPASHPNYQPGKTYEIGVVRRRDGQPGYVLQWDFYCGGFGLEKVVGPDCGALKQGYALAAAKRAMVAKGFRVSEKTLPNGQIQLVGS